MPILSDTLATTLSSTTAPGALAGALQTTSSLMAHGGGAAGGGMNLMMERWVSLAGMFVLLLIAWLLSTNRRVINWRVVIWGIGLQIVGGVLVLGVPALGFKGPLHNFFAALNDIFDHLMSYTDQGAGFVFGPLASRVDPMGAVYPWGVIFAFKILPSVIFFSSLMAVFYYLGVMQKVVMGCAWLMQKFLGTSGAETLSTAANIFVGQTEAPLVVRPYIARMTRSELFVVMAGGMANTAGSVLIAFVAMMKDRFPDIAGHLLTATLMSAPASFAICKLMIPETEVPETRGTVNIHQEKFEDANVVEAAARGATDGIGLAMNIAAILIAFIALIALCNGILGWVGGVIHFNDWGAGLVPHSLLKDGHAALSLETIFGWLFSPLAFIMGVPWKECGTVGALLGQKVVLNEFVAYGNMSQIANQLSDRAVVIASYALSGFANFSSIAIQIGGIGGMAPARRSEIARLGLKAVIGGSLASFLTATIAGFLL